MEQRKRVQESYKSAIRELKKKSQYEGPDYEVSYSEFFNTQWTQWQKYA